MRAGMVAHPREYPWSSWRAHALGAADSLVRDHPLYRALGPTAADLQKEYRALFRAALDQRFVDALRAATNGGWALGDARFKREIAKAAGRRVAPLPKGRPHKGKRDRRQLSLLAPNSSRSLNNGRPTLVGRLSSETASDLDGPERIAPA